MICLTNTGSLTMDHILKSSKQKNRSYISCLIVYLSPRTIFIYYSSQVCFSIVHQFLWNLNRILSFKVPGIFLWVYFKIRSQMNKCYFYFKSFGILLLLSYIMMYLFCNENFFPTLSYKPR